MKEVTLTTELILMYLLITVASIAIVFTIIKLSVKAGMVAAWKQKTKDRRTAEILKQRFNNGEIQQDYFNEQFPRVDY